MNQQFPYIFSKSEWIYIFYARKDPNFFKSFLIS